MKFPTRYDQVLEKLEAIDAVSYGRTRNFINGAVTRLSPYISRGVISTQLVLKHIMQQGHNPKSIEKFVQELAWRDYWQQIWLEKGDQINGDLKRPQPDVLHFELPTAIQDHQTGINAIDSAISEFYQSGYLHNHVRMYIAAITCNIGKSHWKTPAHWMYYHLLDGDWASNALSWQWVAGSNANKKYVANQENINRYCYSDQRNTFLDVPYSHFDSMEVPKALQQTVTLDLQTKLTAESSVTINPEKPTLIYNYYNLDPNWRSDVDANRILLLEPSVFKRYPVSDNAMNFALGLSKNIPDIQLYVGEFDQIQPGLSPGQTYFKEHPLNGHYTGIEDSRDWMFSVSGYFPSFFAFWKKCRKEWLS